MEYLRLCIFLFILSPIVSVDQDEELQAFHLLENTNVTLENGLPEYYTTYCYYIKEANMNNCTNIITFYPNSNRNSAAIIEVGTDSQFQSNCTISLNTSYTANDGNGELMPFTPSLGIGYYKIIKLFVLNLTSEISPMNVWDAIDHVVRRCEVVSGGIPPSSGPECKINLQCLAYVNCINLNINDKGSKQQVYMRSQINGAYSFVMNYIIIIPYVISLLFSVLNIVLFIQLKSLRSSFMMFVIIQSFYCIFWFLCFFLYTACNYNKGLFGLQFNNLSIGSNKSISVGVYTIAVSLMFLCSYGIEVIRFFKALSRVLALRFPLWSADKLTIKHALFPCLSAFILGIIAWVFVVLNQTGKHTPDGIYLGTVISICGGRDIMSGNSVLYIIFGWDCFPQFIIYDELCPLNLITLLLDFYVFFLLKLQLSKLNEKQKKLENVLKLFIVMDLIDVSYSCFRRIIFFVHFPNSFYDYSDFSSQWSMFYYNSFARYIFNALYFVDVSFFYVIRLIFYAIEMMVCQLLMRRIQAIENPHDIPRNFVDRVLLRFTKNFYTKVLRVEPTTMINNSTNIVGK